MLPAIQVEPAINDVNVDRIMDPVQFPTGARAPYYELIVDSSYLEM